MNTAPSAPSSTTEADCWIAAAATWPDWSISQDVVFRSVDGLRVAYAPD